MVHPPQGGRGHAGCAGAIRSLQGLLYQGDGLEVVLLPEAGQVGMVAKGLVPGVTLGHRERTNQGSCTCPSPTAQGPVSPVSRSPASLGSRTTQDAGSLTPTASLFLRTQNLPLLHPWSKDH